MHTYVALLRGINVGGNKKVSMAALKQLFEELGFSAVSTYINSGNVLFSNPDGDVTAATARIESAINHTFGFDVKVLVCARAVLASICAIVPTAWKNDASMKCDVMFLWPEVNNKAIVAQLEIKKPIDEVIYTNGAIIWRIDKQHVTKSGIVKLIGTDLYKHMTIRNINTVRALHQRLEQST